MNIVLKNGQKTLVLERNFSLNNFKYSTRNRIENSALQDGGRQIGLNLFDYLEFEIEGSIKNKGINTDLALSKLISWLKINSGFSLYISPYLRYLEKCYLKEVETETFVRGDFVKIKLKIISEECYWKEDFTYTYNNTNSVIIPNNGDYPTYPIIKLKIKTPQTSLTLQNLSLPYVKILTFNYILNENDIIEIDMFNNKILVNNTLLTEYSNGNFFVLELGNNNLKANSNMDWEILVKERFTY